MPCHDCKALATLRCMAEGVGGGHFMGVLCGHPAPSSRAGCDPAHAPFIGPALFWRTQVLHQERCILGGAQNQKT